MNTKFDVPIPEMTKLLTFAFEDNTVIVSLCSNIVFNLNADRLTAVTEMTFNICHLNTTAEADPEK